jgi:hypothetical protein
MYRRLMRSRLRLAAWLGVVLACGTFAAAAAASCPHERSVGCGSFRYRTGRRTYRPHAIRFALNGRPRCAQPRRLIRIWLRHRRSRIVDGSTTWTEISRNPFEFVAGLCGDLTFRL